MDQSFRTLEYEGPQGTEQVPVLGEVDDLQKHPHEPGPEPVQRRWLLPAVLFVLTCVSTFVAGAGNAAGGGPGVAALMAGDRTAITRIFADNWQAGVTYMLAVMGILLAHEMGHFLQAVRYHVPASWPFFIPMPITQIGTMGAVIGMQGSQANRKELFDIGLSGPLAGLVVAIPVLYYGVMLEPKGGTGFGGEYGVPLLLQWMFEWLRPEDAAQGVRLFGTLNPLLMAGWVGLFITGLNMLPVSQLDGGHVAYALLGRHSYWLARGVILAAIAYIVITGVLGWIVMLMLVMAIGTDHPPTHDDTVPLGRWRVILGYLSLGLSVICLTPNPFH